jgi:hypothetical protein
MIFKECHMRVGPFSGAMLLVTALVTGTAATSGDRTGPAGQWAIAYLSTPTLIGGNLVQGQVLFTHDDTIIGRDQPCTTVHLLEPARGAVEEVASVHCIRVPATVVRQFTVRTRPNDDVGFGCVLTAFQFAGDSVEHQLPSVVVVH